MEKMKHKKSTMSENTTRNPLQHLNHLPFQKPISKITSNPSSSSNPKTTKKPFPMVKKSAATNKSKENQFPKKPFSHKPNWNQNQPTKKPISTNPQRSNLSQKFQGNSNSKLLSVAKNTSTTNLKNVDNCTPPVVKTATVHDLNSKNYENVVEDTICNSTFTPVKTQTPPVEASVSPEIQCGLLAKSIATPVCYGAGHILSGVTDKRKCRRRGSLKGGTFERTNLLFDDVDEKGFDGNVSDDFPVPLLAEASVRWVELSPCDEECDDQGGGVVKRCGIVCDEDLGKVDLGGKSCRDFGSVVGLLSSGNMMKTPDSDLSSYVWPKVKKLREENVVVPMRDEEEQFEEREGSVCSLVCDSTLEILRLSEMMVSWRDDELVSGFDDENDELDCCCLSDEKIGVNAGGNGVETTYVGAEKEEEIDYVSPVLLDYEPSILVRGKEKLTPCMHNTCAESIFTDGGGLVSSDDSDWTYNNSLENHLYLDK